MAPDSGVSARRSECTPFVKASGWVLLYYDGALDERQATVITSRFGILSGKKIVRGRENECEQFHRTQQATRGIIFPKSAPF